MPDLLLEAGLMVRVICMPPRLLRKPGRMVTGNPGSKTKTGGVFGIKRGGRNQELEIKGPQEGNQKIN